MNLDYAKPFSNTSNLVNMTPKIFKKLAESREDQESEVRGGYRQSPLLIEAKAGLPDGTVEQNVNEPKSYQFIQSIRD